MANIDREVESAIGEFFKLLVNFLSMFFKRLWHGIKCLRKKNNIILFLLAIIIAMSVYFFRSRIFLLNIPKSLQYIILGSGVGSPVILLLLLEQGKNSLNKEQLRYQELFESISFKGRDGKCPLLCNISENGKKEVFIFTSMIPLQEWKKNKSILETIMDKNILAFEHGQGKQVVRLTAVPNDCIIPEMLLWDDRYISEKSGVIEVGQGALKKVIFDLNRTPHVLIAGETGSGKSVILRACLHQMIQQGAKVFMFDFKGGVEFGKQYERFGEVVTERGRALKILEILVRENEYRLTIFRDLEVKNLPEYNEKTGQNLCRIGLFCDEIAEMLDKKGVSKQDKEVYEQIEGKLSTLARLSRATGINLIMGVQRPDANILTGQIKNNIPVRICGRFADKAASEIVLGNTDAVDLPDIKGRFLYRSGNEVVEFQSYFFEDEMAFRNEPRVPVGEMLTEAPTNSDRQPTQVKQNPVIPVFNIKADRQDKIYKNSKRREEQVTGKMSDDNIDKLLKEMDEYDLPTW